MMNSKYDEFGVLKDTQWINNIPIGTWVEYIDTKNVNRKQKKVKLIGIWNGEYVAFNDKEKTIVRTTRWLTIVDNIDKKTKF